MFLGVFPAWVGDLLSVFGLPAILLLIVQQLLQRKQANRKLVVDEGTLKRSEFDSFTTAQNDALEGARQEIKDAKADAREANDHADRLDDAFEAMREAFYRLRSWARKTLENHHVELTAEELAEFEATKPPPRPSRRTPQQ